MKQFLPPADVVSIGLCLLLSSAGHAMAKQDVWPAPVQVQLDQLLSDCRRAGGQPLINPGAVTKAALTDGGFSDHIIWTDKIECVGAYMVYGGTAGQMLVLVPKDGRGQMTVYAHSWKLSGDGPMAVEYVGGIACAQGHLDRCDWRLAWNGTTFAPVTESPRVQTVNQSGGQPRSIVGDWAENQDGCASPMAGLVRIGPKSLATDEFVCVFRDVSRSGTTVSWTGTCDEGKGQRPAKVTATDNNGRLTISFANGNTWAPLRRCSR